MGDPILQRVKETQASTRSGQTGLERVCIFCLMPKARVKLDKNGSPFLSCLSCGSRAFMKGAESFRGVSLMQELVPAVVGDDPRRLWNLQAELDGERSIASTLYSFAQTMVAWASKPAPGPLSPAPAPPERVAPAA